MKIDNYDMVLKVLPRILTNTLDHKEPNPDGSQVEYVRDFTNLVSRSDTYTMLPLGRLKNLYQTLQEVVYDVEGDVIETGVWRGGACIYMAAVLEFFGSSKAVWVADSFEGLPSFPYFESDEKIRAGKIIRDHCNNFAVSLEEVRDNFLRFGLLNDRVHFLKGWFSDTLDRIPLDQKFSLIRLDGDYYQSTKTALKNLYPKLSPGGICIIDDYGEEAWTDCRKAVDEYLLEQGICPKIENVDSKCIWWKKE